jgi:hypothetical protein
LTDEDPRPSPQIMHLETSADSRFVILSEAKDLIFLRTFEILRSLRSLRMTRGGTFTEVSSWYYSSNFAAMGMRRPMPKALEVIFRPGAAWRRLYSLLSMVRITHCTVWGSNPSLTMSS